MRIVHLSTRDLAGGAARAAYRLHAGLRAQGHDSRMLVGYKGGLDPEVVAVNAQWGLFRKALRRAVHLVDRYLSLQYLYAPSSSTVLQHDLTRTADIIHLHNLHGGAFSHTILPRLSRRVPVVWTLLDMWPLTGHCAYSYDCERWKTGCGRCPILSDYPALAVDTTALLWRIKQWVYRRSEMTIVTPSRWFAELVRQSPLLGRFRVHQIPLGLDTRVFKPLPKPAARLALGLPDDAKVIVFVAAGVAERRKGVTFAFQALRELARAGTNHVWLVTVGPGRAMPEPAEMPYPLRHLGEISDDHLLATCYSAADLLVAPSLVEGFGQVFSEAMACGTPCVAFETGGVPEVVRHLETGYLARRGDALDLAKGLGLLLDNEELRRRMSARCRQVAEEEYSLELMARRHLELYEELLARRRLQPMAAS